jgi:hypothetical protein
MLVMPSQSHGVGALPHIQGRPNLVTVKSVVVLPVVEHFLDAPADLEAQIRRYRYIAGVEQTMDVASRSSLFRASCVPPYPPVTRAADSRWTQGQVHGYGLK